MSTVAEAEELIFSLPEKDRAQLAAKLLASLPAPFPDDDDDGVEEALRRSKELKENPEMAITLDELDLRMRERFQ